MSDTATLFEQSMRRELAEERDSFPNAIRVTVGPGIEPAAVKETVKYFEDIARRETWVKARDYYRGWLVGMGFTIAALLFLNLVSWVAVWSLI